MRFVDLNGDKETHYEEVHEYARQRQESELRLREERQVREWFATELDNTSFLRLESGNLMKYVVREVQSLKLIYSSFEPRMDEIVKAEQLWNDFLLYNLNLFAENLIAVRKRKLFILNFAEKVLHMENSVAEDFVNNYYDSNRKYMKYMAENFSFEKNADKQFWRLLCHKGEVNQIEHFTKIYIRFIYFYTFYLYLKVLAEDFNLCKKELKQYRAGIGELLWNQKNGRNLLPDIKKMDNPLYRSAKQKYLQDIMLFTKALVFSLNKTSDKEGDVEMIEELYRQIQEQIIAFENLDSVLPEEIKQEVHKDRLPEFQDYASGVLQENEKIHYLDHTVLYQGKEDDEDIQFYSYKGVLLFTDRRIVFEGEYILDLDYEDVSRVTAYEIIPEILEIRSGNKVNYFQLPDTETAYKILKVIAKRKNGRDKADDRQISLSYEELVKKADIKSYIFAFDYMAAGALPQELKEKLKELNNKLRGLQKTIEQNPQRKEEIYQFLHYYIPEAVSLVHAYQGYQGTGLADSTVKEVYKKVETAVLALDGAVYQKILEIYQTSARDTMAGADALKEILGQDGYVDSSYTMNK